MSKLEEIYSVYKEQSPFFIVGWAVLSAAGLIPRFGLVRAAWIALRSRFAFKPVPESLRSTEANLLKEIIARKDFRQSYVVVTGETGVGKTSLLRTATSKMPGVITVQAQPGDDQDTIVNNTLKELTRIKYDIMDPFGSAERVIFWHRIFTIGRSPIVLIDAKERMVGESHASLSGAVRTLVEDYKLLVVVHGSPNSLPDSLLQTKRQIIFEVEPMTRKVIWKIPQFQDLFKFTKEAGLDDTVYAVLGGIPARYEQLWENTRIDLMQGEDCRHVIGTQLCAEIFEAIYQVQEFCGNDDATIAKLIMVFQENRVFKRSTLVENEIQPYNPDNVFREVEQDGTHVLIPALNSIGIVLQHGLTKEPTFDELEAMVKPKI